ncbi:hypothetical protein PVAG01_03143 [Phlyctema vagabunda]|uniref:Uncharacterized protein n=1 Tax=Phlyctema vagabunda TaxID=108571 RepID=A0ABR4PT81_9HELO
MTSTEELLKRLDAQHQAYLDTFRLVHEALLSGAASTATSTSTSTLPRPALSLNNTGHSHNNPFTSGTPPTSISTSTGSVKFLKRRSGTLDTETDRPSPPPPNLLSPTKTFTFQSSILTGDSDPSDADEDEDLYVQAALPSQSFDVEHLRTHLKTYRFNDETRRLLDGVLLSNGRLKHPALFVPGQGNGCDDDDENDSSVGSHYSVFDVGPDGAPLSRAEIVRDAVGIDDAIWQVIRDVNSDATKERKAVGRITIVREPSPLIFGALHLTMNEYFDMDEIYRHLVQDNDTNATHPLMGQDRAFSPDHRRQRSFVFAFEYFTIVSPDCQPMPWQSGDHVYSSTSRIPISRCCSIVALSLSGPPIRRLKNISRRNKEVQYGHVYDPWAPWHVLSTQCYPDLKHSMDTHDSSRHYTNGPEAFLYTLLAEFRDAQKRFEEILHKISKLVTPPADFMFNSKLRDALLFEDANFTYSRRYFWAYQTLGIMNQNIKSMVDAYTDTFPAPFWAGEHRHLWPVVERESARSAYYLKRLQLVRRDFEREVAQLRAIALENNERRKEIRTLRDQLFSGTSVLESRKSVEMASITIQQGHNIKLLTLVSIFFLPLTFVTSVFGMTNMSTEHTFNTFGIVMATVCIPFFFLIGSLNTTQGMEFWIGKWHALLSHLSFSSKSKSKSKSKSGKNRSSSSTHEKPAFKAEAEEMSAADTAWTGDDPDAATAQIKTRKRSLSHLEALAKRRRVKRFGILKSRSSNALTPSGASKPRTESRVGVGRDLDGGGAGEEEEEEEEGREQAKPWWFARILGRRRRMRAGAGVGVDGRGVNVGPLGGGDSAGVSVGVRPGTNVVPVVDV